MIESRNYGVTGGVRYTWKGFRVTRHLGAFAGLEGSFDKLESYQGDESPQHNEMMSREVLAQNWRFHTSLWIWHQSGSCSLQLFCSLEIHKLPFFFFFLKTSQMSFETFWKSTVVRLVQCERRVISQLSASPALGSFTLLDLNVVLPAAEFTDWSNWWAVCHQCSVFMCEQHKD